MNNKPYPFLLKPVGKDYLWGGERLNKEFNKNIKLNPLAETWECSTHSDGMSVVNSGIHKGKALKEILKENPEYLGKYSNNNGDLPVLIKLIDAKKDLSVQVHPDDEYANTFENGQNGKNEMWYIVDSEPGSSLVYGFSKPLSKDELRYAIEKGTLENYLNRIQVKSGDSFYIKARTVHAIGAGLLIAEVQQNSNLTYRLYDYNRIDANGKKRELHIDKSVDVSDLSVQSYRNNDKEIVSYQGYDIEKICECEYFNVCKLKIKGSCIDKEIQIQKDSFRVILCISGIGKIEGYDFKSLEFKKGDCIFIPANLTDFEILGNAEMLYVN